jgi:hypothetical protein
MKRAIVIGNSPSVLEYEYGKFIDEYFDIVLRCNWYQINGYEKYVGTKTNIWFTRLSKTFVDAYKHPNKFHKLDNSVYDVDEYWLRVGSTFKGETDEFKRDMPNTVLRVKGHDIFLKNFDVNRITKAIPSNTMCIGLQLIQTASKVFDEVWSFGNTFHMENLPKGKLGRYHYYDLDSNTSILDEKNFRKHNYTKEMEILKGLNVNILEYKNGVEDLL